MIRSVPAFLFLSATLLIASCKRENKIPIIVVTPATVDIAATSGDVIGFGIECRTDNSRLSRLHITAKRGNGFTTTLKDSSLTGTRFNWTWEYLVANATQPYNELLTFTVYDANGETMVVQRTIYVTLGATVLTETSGHNFYSRNSAIHPESAFDLQDRVQVLYTADSARRDVQDKPINGTTDVLSRTWVSPAGGRFVRFNGFDYANATDLSLRSAYISGIPLEQLDNMAVGDIVLTKLGSLPANTSYYAVLRVMDIVDEAGTSDNDRYVFNMKWAVFVQ